MSERFDLDKLLEPRSVVIGGVEHNVHELTLKESLLIQEKLKKGMDDLTFSRECLALYLPDLDIENIPIRAVKHVLSFLSGNDAKNEK